MIPVIVLMVDNGFGTDNDNKWEWYTIQHIFGTPKNALCGILWMRMLINMKLSGDGYEQHQCWCQCHLELWPCGHLIDMLTDLMCVVMTNPEIWAKGVVRWIKRVGTYTHLMGHSRAIIDHLEHM